MKTQRSVMSFVLLGVAALVGLGLLISAAVNTGGFASPQQEQKAGGPINSNDVWSSPTPAALQGAYPGGVRNLVGASPQQVGQFAKEYAKEQLDARGESQVLLSMPVKREEVTALGLGCLAEFGAIEEPPLMLVILKGDFTTANIVGGAQGAQRRTRVGYVAYVFDVWAAEPTLLIASKNGALFRNALKDPSLPVETSSMPKVCPTSPPYTKTVHYGGYAPGFTPVPTQPPGPTPTFPPVPSPLPTYMVNP